MKKQIAKLKKVKAATKAAIGVFFGKFGKGKTQVEKAEEMLMLYMKHLPSLRKAMSPQNMELSDGNLLGQMYDFYKDAEGNTNMQITAWSDPVRLSGGGGENGEDYGDKRIVKKPVEVLVELETVPTPFNSTDTELQRKIDLLGSKSRLSNQRFVKEQIEGMKQRLENRKQYHKHVEFFAQFPNTTDEKIDALINKYTLEFNTSDLFVPAFPEEAINVMEAYTEVCKQVSNEAPVFYVIAEAKDFKTKRKKLDPILLVQSPFGFFWQILGAWDKEMVIISEL